MKATINTNSKIISYREMIKREGWYYAINSDYNLLVVADSNGKNGIALAVNRNSFIVYRVTQDHAWGSREDFMSLEDFSITV